MIDTATAFDILENATSKLYYLVHEFDNGDREEKVVVAESENDAIAACGYTAYKRDEFTIEHLGYAVKKDRGIVCWGYHAKDEQE